MKMGNLTNSIYYKAPIALQNFLVSAYGQHLFKKRYSGKIYQEILSILLASERWSADEIEQYQSEQLYKLIAHCRKNVPYYGNLLASLGYTEQDFTRINSLSKLPILEKSDVRKHSTDLKTVNTKPFMVQNTSGSTGSPLTLWTDEFTYKLAMALVVQHEELHGVKQHAPRATFAGRMVQPINHNRPPFSRYNKAENQRIFSSYHLNENTFQYYQKELNEFSPEEIIGYPSAIYNLALHYKRLGISPNFKPKLIVTNSETLMSNQRELIEELFDTKIRDYYGTAEYVTFASQCKAGNYHFNPIIGITEVIQKDHHENFGEVIATTLTNYAMPLIRYKIGDTAAPLRKQCDCGKHTVFTDEILGRIDDAIITEDGRHIGRIDHIFKGLDNIKEAQVIQEKLNHCTIRIAKANKNNPIDSEQLAANLKARTGQSMELDIEYVDAIPRGANQKFRGVIRSPDLLEQRT